MKLVHKNLEKQIIFEENKVNEIVVENPTFFYNFISEMKSQLNGDAGNFVLSKNNKEISLTKETELITDIFSFELNDKKFVTKLYNELKNISYSEELYMETQTILSQIEEYLKEIECLSQYNFSFNNEADIINIFKAYGINFDINNNKLVDRFFQLISMTNELLNKNIIIIVNLKSFISMEELKELYSMISYKKINLLLIESSEKYKLDLEERIIIDKDICEIF
jgi:CRISPR type II-A/NMEMI-associated protein Csn2